MKPAKWLKKQRLNLKRDGGGASHIRLWLAPLCAVLLLGLSEDSYVSQPALVGLFASISLVFLLSRRIDIFVSTFLGWGVFTYFLSFAHEWPYLNPKAVMSLGFWGGWKLAALLALFILAQFKVNLLRLCQSLCIINLALTIWCHLTKNHDRYGLIYAASFNSAFTIWLIPSLFVYAHRIRCLPILFLAIASVAIQPGAMSIVLLCFYCVAFLVSRPTRFSVLINVFSGLAFIFYYQRFGLGQFQEQTRLSMWVESIRFVAEHNMRVIGYGLGSFQAFGHVIEQAAGAKDGLWLSLHNDWLQIYFEEGFIGLALAVISFVRIYLKLRDWEKAVWLGGGLVAFFFFPWQHPIWALPLTWLAAKGSRTGCRSA